MNELFITPITPWNLTEGTTQTAGIKGQDGVSTFKGIFEEAIENVRTTEDNLVNEQYLLATGQIEDPHTVMIASSEAQLAVDMLVSLRTKALEAYNEIMRISV